MQDFTRKLLAGQPRDVRARTQPHACITSITKRSTRHRRPDNRHRRPRSSGDRAADAVGCRHAERDLQWLATEQEKVASSRSRIAYPRADLPALTFTSGASQTVRCTDHACRCRSGWADDVFCLGHAALAVDFRMFLERHAEVFQALPRGRWSAGAASTANAVAPLPERRFETVQHARPTHLEERWSSRREESAPSRTNDTGGRRVRSTAAVSVLYRAWVDYGDGVLDATASPVLANAIARQAGRFSTVSGSSLSPSLPLVGTA